MPENESKTLVFCTCFAPDPTVWRLRYRRWVEALLESNLHFDQLLIIDDGSPQLPNWSDTQLVEQNTNYSIDKRILLYHFSVRLGRPSSMNFPGWYRSFTFSSSFAQLNGFSKIIHIESDAYLVSESMVQYFNSFCDGWAAPWCARQFRPESAIQVIAGDSIPAFHAWAATEYSEIVNKNHENAIPFSKILWEFVGDRYGEYLSFVPRDADWVAQSRWNDPWTGYFWWTVGQANFPSSLDDPSAMSAACDPSRLGSLDGIGRQFAAEKSSLRHHYLQFYEPFLEHLRTTESARMLEIGVGDGASLRTWAAFFPNATIVGVDKDRQCREHVTAHIRIDIADQTNVAELMRVALNYFPLDLVIDDGSHMWEDQIHCFKSLYPLLKPGGIYIIEGIETSYGRHAEEYRGLAEQSTTGYLKKFLDYLVAEYVADSAAEADSFLRSYPRHTEFLVFHRGTCLLKRKSV
jgi:predicted O-methyltransferase YrrM